VEAPDASDHICCSSNDWCLKVYSTLFREMGFRLPLNNFEVEILNYLSLSLSQLHPHGWVYLHYFRRICCHSGLSPKVLSFLCLHTMKWESIGPSDTQCMVSFSFVVFKRLPVLADDFRSRFVIIKPATELAHRLICHFPIRPAISCAGPKLLSFFWRGALSYCHLVSW
jgi:hypothetical protein